MKPLTTDSTEYPIDITCAGDKTHQVCIIRFDCNTFAGVAGEKNGAIRRAFCKLADYMAVNSEED